jgi:hypothetical protein
VTRSSADVFDQTVREYACAGSVDPLKPHLRKAGEGRGSWGVVRLPGVPVVPWDDAARAAAYAWCKARNEVRP